MRSNSIFTSNGHILGKITIFGHFDKKLDSFFDQNVIMDHLLGI